MSQSRYKLFNEIMGEGAMRTWEEHYLHYESVPNPQELYLSEKVKEKAMHSVQVNGASVIALSGEQQTTMNEILHNPHLTQSQKHALLCHELKLGCLFPAVAWRPYAMKATLLEFFDFQRKIVDIGGWHQCAVCGHQIIQKPSGVVGCPKCSSNRLPNFLQIVPMKRK